MSNTNFLSKLKTVGKRKEHTFEYEGIALTVRDISGNMRDYWDADAKKRVKFKGRNPDLNTLQTEGQRALMVAMTLVNDESGDLAYDYKNTEDLAAIGELSGALLDRVFDEAMALCGMTPAAQEEAEGN